jgi:hypothetical protein
MERRIFGIGLSRTGTTSLHFLLESLGYKSRHFVNELILDPNWELDSNYNVFMDSPIPLLYQQLDRKYPNSKFILTIRSKNNWLESMKWMFTHGKVIWNWPSSTQEYHRKFYHTTHYNRRVLSKHYDVFHNDVGNYFKSRPGDLLILNIDEGLSVKKVCEFLNIPEKTIAYPKTNERKYATLKQRIKYNIHYAVYKTNLQTPI